MYYTEKIINGILHYKSLPTGEWRQVSAEEMTRRLQVNGLI